jgi:hypothetical protein
MLCINVFLSHRQRDIILTFPCDYPIISSYMARHLNTKRLYKLVSRTVIVITIVSFIVALLLINRIAGTNYLDDQSAAKVDATFYCLKRYPDLINAPSYRDCVDEIMIGFNQTNTMILWSVLMTIFLPTLFVGGSRLYSYLHPVSIDHKRR